MEEWRKDRQNVQRQNAAKADKKAEKNPDNNQRTDRYRDDERGNQ